MQAEGYAGWLEVANCGKAKIDLKLNCIGALFIGQLDIHHMVNQRVSLEREQVLLMLGDRLSMNHQLLRGLKSWRAKAGLVTRPN